MTGEPALALGRLETLMQRYQQADVDAAATLVDELSVPILRFYLAQVRDRGLDLGVESLEAVRSPRGICYLSLAHANVNEWRGGA